MGHTILLADDSITIQKVIELTFSDEDFKLHTVSNGQKAMDEIRAVKPDIVLCDIIMPEKNGYEVCEFIKSTADLKHIPVLLLTGAFEPFDQERARQAGCDGFLAKPFEPQTLISKVRELLAAGKKPGAAPTKPAPSPAPAPPKPAAVAPPATVALPGRPATPPTPVASSAHAGGGEEATVLFPFGQEGAQKAPTAPSDAVEDFAYDVGDRELAVEPGDRNLLIEPEESGPAESVTSDDIWGQVPEAQAPSPAEHGETEEDGATVMMRTPFSVEPSAPQGFDSGAGFDELVVPAPSFEPPSEVEVTPEPAEPELTPMGDFGFDAFAATDQGGAATPGAEIGESTMLFSGVPPSPAPPGSSGRAATTSPGGPAGSTDWGADADAGGAGWTQEPMLTPTWEEQAPAAPSAASAWEEPAVPAEAWEDVPAAVWEEASPAAQAPPLASARQAPPGPTATPPSREEPVRPAKPAAKEALAARPLAPPAAPTNPTAPGMPGIMDARQLDELAEKVAQKIISRISPKVIQEIAWEVVPDLAETLIRKEIEALKAKIPR